MSKYIELIKLNEKHGIDWVGDFDDFMAEVNDSYFRVEQMAPKTWWWQFIKGNKMRVGYSGFKTLAMIDCIKAYEDLIHD